MLSRCSQYSGLSLRPITYARRSASMSAFVNSIGIVALQLKLLVIACRRHRLRLGLPRSAALRTDPQAQREAACRLSRALMHHEPRADLAVDDTALPGELLSRLFGSRSRLGIALQ